jgi:Mor family transcriptional regulator
MNEIQALLGNEAARRFVAAFRGQVIVVPKRMSHGHKIAVVIGYEAALELSRRMGGVHLNVTTGYRAKLLARNEEIRAYRRQGMKINELATRYSLTSRQISNIINK